MICYWADDGTLDLLHYLVSRWHRQETPIFLLITLRQETIQSESAWQSWLDRLNHEATYQEIALHPLEQTSLTLMLAREAGSTIPSAVTQRLSQWLFKETEGHPFFLTEMLHMLTEHNMLVYQTDSGRRTLDVDETIARIDTAGNFSGPHQHSSGHIGTATPYW